MKRLGKTATDVDKALSAYRVAIDQRPEVQKNYLEAAQLAYVNKRWATAVQIMDRSVAHDASARNRDSFDVLIGALIKAGNGKPGLTQLFDVINGKRPENEKLADLVLEQASRLSFMHQ